MTVSEESAVQLLDFVFKSGTWLSICDQLKKIDVALQGYDRTLLTFPVMVKMDAAELLNAAPSLFLLLVTHPPDFGLLMSWVIRASAVQCGLTLERVGDRRFPPSVLLTELPPVNDFQLTFAGEAHENGLTSLYRRVEGVVVAVEPVKKYTISERFRGFNNDCALCCNFSYIRTFNRQRDWGTGRKREPVCEHCLFPFTRDMSSQQMGHYRMAVLRYEDNSSKEQNKENASAIQGRALFAEVKIILRDVLKNCVELGSSFSVCGLVKYKKKRNGEIDMLLDACSVQEFTQNSKFRIKYPLTNLLRTRITQLLAELSQSPFSVASAFCYVFGSNVAPKGRFFHLKLLTLLSLMGGCTGESRFLNLLVFSACHESAFELLKLGSNLLDRSLLCASGFDTQPSTRRKNGNLQQSKGNPLLLASGELCVIDLCPLKVDCFEKLVEMTRSIGASNRVDQDDAEKNEIPESKRLSCQGTIWALDEVERSFSRRFNQTPQQRALTWLMDGCGLVCRAGTSNEEQDSIRPLLRLFRMDNGQLERDSVNKRYHSDNYDEDEFKYCINARRNSTVVQTPEALDLMRRYYLASRRMKGIRFPESAMDLLLCLASAYAKLSFRSVLIVEDALMAIKLYEDSVDLIQVEDLGNAYLRTISRATVGDRLSTYVNDLNDEMKDFQQKLASFLGIPHL